VYALFDTCGFTTVVVFGALAAAIAFLAATVPGPITQVSIYDNFVHIRNL